MTHIKYGLKIMHGFWAQHSRLADKVLAWHVLGSHMSNSSNLGSPVFPCGIFPEF